MSGVRTIVVFPGQGSHARGMGDDLFERFPEVCREADDILGYSIRELCLHNAGGRLQQTQFAQPALFVVNALSYLARGGPEPSLLAGHSLGEYNALLAAGCFDFATGLRLVRRRGELMGQERGGSMLAVVGLKPECVAELLTGSGIDGIDVANYNSPSQVVLSGPREALQAITARIESASGRCLPLNVSAAFHSRYMARAADAFATELRGITLRDPRIPVLSNVTARPYEPGSIATLLAKQIESPVRWSESMEYSLMNGIEAIESAGPGRVLIGLWDMAKKAKLEGPSPRGEARCAIDPGTLGSSEFRRDFGVRYAYLAGSMYNGIASVDLVCRLGERGLMGFLGTGGLTLDEISRAIDAIQQRLGRGGVYGVNFLHSIDDPAYEDRLTELYLSRGVRFIEAAAFLQITPALVHLRFQGAHCEADGKPRAMRHIVAKVSRPEIATAFMQPPSEALLERLVIERRLTRQEAAAARELPISQHICVEADSGGHTDRGVAYTLMPAMLRLRDELAMCHRYAGRIAVGAAGGIGTPEAAAAAFILGADFLVTGSINQCSPEAGTSDRVKEILSTLGVQDTAYAPAGDMFELGASVQVVRKGTLFAARANKLHQLYRQHGSLDEIDRETRRTIEQTWFRRSFDEVWIAARTYHERKGRHDTIERAERNPKQKMALVFKWYFADTTRAAIVGDDDAVNYQIHCGPAMGAFNSFVRGTELEPWRNRHVDAIAEALMRGTTEVLSRRFRAIADAATTGGTA